MHQQTVTVPQRDKHVSKPRCTRRRKEVLEELHVPYPSFSGNIPASESHTTDARSRLFQRNRQIEKERQLAPGPCTQPFAVAPRPQRKPPFRARRTPDQRRRAKQRWRANVRRRLGVAESGQKKLAGATRGVPQGHQASHLNTRATVSPGGSSAAKLENNMGEGTKIKSTAAHVPARATRAIPRRFLISCQ
jgi:hypothetical protein